MGSGYVYCNKVEICGVNTSKLPVLKEKEKIELLKKKPSGGQTGKEELISGNLRWCSVWCRNFPTEAKILMTCFRSDASV